MHLPTPLSTACGSDRAASSSAAAVQPARRLLLLAAAAVLAGCASSGKRGSGGSTAAIPKGRGGGAAAVNPLALNSDLREALLARTMLVVNTPYTYGGNSPEGGFDCSGLIQWAVAGIHGARLPRTTAQWAQASTPVSRGLERGDFVFFNTLGGAYSHMGIYVGNGQFVHAPSSGGTVQRVRMDNVYFAKRYTEARSIFA
ncbi:C40 family peptidase [Comamonas sp. GB3 AK4-5]|uniref:C40 family peptidase n=1 Tax=Comamonas sp. GB3 AK4-5 TaxID=3231487 RepID=UPI00351E83BF